MVVDIIWKIYMHMKNFLPLSHQEQWKNINRESRIGNFILAGKKGDSVINKKGL